ncbi:hypothetical protein FQZ97_588850 [compost metagenome]
MAGMTAENDRKTSRPIGRLRARGNRRPAPVDRLIHYTYAASKMLKITAVRRVEDRPVVVSQSAVLGRAIDSLCRTA